MGETEFRAKEKIIEIIGDRFILSFQAIVAPLNPRMREVPQNISSSRRRIRHDVLATTYCVGPSSTSSGKSELIFRCLSIPGYLNLTPISSVIFFPLGGSILLARLFAQPAIRREHKTIHAKMAKSKSASK